MTKTIDTLVDDIYSVVKDKIELTPENEKIIDEFGKSVAEIFKRRVTQQEERKGLRLSSIGHCVTKQYYNETLDKKEDLPAHTLIKFMYGDLTEEMLLALAKLSEHEVRGEQDEIEIEGVKGHRDVVIDGKTVDVKSASARGFQKFADGSIKDNDPFGYIQQISSYTQGADDVDKDAGYLLALHKELGTLALCEIKAEDMPNMKHRVHEVKEAMEQPFPPARPYEAEPMGAKGNMKLPITCSYCSHKFECWKEANDGKGLRTFKYASGPVYLTKVEDTPRVEEII